MSYSIPIEMCFLPETSINFSSFLQTLKLKNSYMILLSEKCYSKLKENSTYVNSKYYKAFVQTTNIPNSCDYIEISNLVSSNCCLVNSISSSCLRYKCSSCIPKKILIIITEEEKFDYESKPMAIAIESDLSESPIDCIINSPNLFDNCIAFLTENAYNRLRKNTNSLSCYLNVERLIWCSDENYYGGDITLQNINCTLSIISHIYFEEVKKTFHTQNLPSKIYFIT